MSAKPIVLILGAGPRIGASVARKFASNGYAVVAASRTGAGTKDQDGVLHVKADFLKSASVKAVFDAVVAEYGASPSVVIYNAGTLTPPPVENSVLSVPAESIASDLNVNTISAYVAAQLAVEGWGKLPKDTKKAFIYTGNISNVAIIPWPIMLTVGIGKSASAYWIGTADTMYASQGYRFFYADERNTDGTLKGMQVDGDAHADFFAQLVSGEKEVPWHATFVKDKGYVKF